MLLLNHEGNKLIALHKSNKEVDFVEHNRENTCKTKRDNRQNKLFICWVLNSVCPGQRKSVGCCVASLLLQGIPAVLAPTLHKHKTTLCDFWLLVGLITMKSTVRAVDLLVCWYCVVDSIKKKIVPASGLGFLSCQRWQTNGNKHQVAKLFPDLLLFQQQIKKLQDMQCWRLTIIYIMCNMHKTD